MTPLATHFQLSAQGMKNITFNKKAFEGTEGIHSIKKPVSGVPKKFTPP